MPDTDSSDLLKRVPLFAGLSDSTLAGLARQLRRHTSAHGERRIADRRDRRGVELTAAIQRRYDKTRSMEAPSAGPIWRRAAGGLWEFAKTLIIAFILAQLIMVSVAQAFQVEQYSMEPTLLPHDRVLVDKFLYRLRQPRRGDVIVLRYPLNPERNYIKRIVALPGDRLEVKDGRLFINTTPVAEPYVNGVPQGDFGPVTVPEDSVFVMGDNRNNSEDSRSFGALKKDKIVGQAVLIYWPPQRIRLLLPR